MFFRVDTGSVVGHCIDEVARRVVGAPLRVQIALAVAIGVLNARAATHTQDIQLVPIAIAISRWQYRAATLKDGAGSLAHPAGIDDAVAGVEIFAVCGEVL